MSTLSLPDTASVRAAVIKLFAEQPPALVEVRFPHMGTSSDWYLCEEEAELETILDRIGSGAEIHLSSVWDLRDATGGVVFRK